MLHCHLCPLRLYGIFPHCLINRMIFKYRHTGIHTHIYIYIYILNIKVFWFYLQILYKTFLILRRAEQDINVNMSSCKVPVTLVTFQWNLNFLDGFSKNTQIPNFMKIRPVGTEFFHADGQTDMTQPIATFRNYANAPTNRWTSVLAHVLLSSGLWYCACVWSLFYDPVPRTT
jgi:hypothetical protein